MIQGFSLTEVLVSLVLMTSVSLLLLKQQWHISQLFNQTQVHMALHIQAENLHERILLDTLTLLNKSSQHG